MAKKYNNIAIRKTNGLILVFFNPNTIYVQHRYGINIYERWFEFRNRFYQTNWQPFRRALTDHRNIDLAYIDSLAEKHEISAKWAKSLPDLKGKKVRKIPEWGRMRNAH